METRIRRQLQQVVAPIEQAHGLPNAVYTDANAFEAEKHAIFAQGWACIGFGKDVPAPATAKPLTFLGQPLVLVRDRDNVLRVFENVCRHRGMILVEYAKTLGSVIRCPYHSWCYNLDGTLRATPHIGGPGINVHDGIDRGTLSLHEVRSAVFMDMVFVNVSGSAPDFADYVGPLATRWAEFVDQPLHHGGESASFCLDVATNWKLAVENYCESYHLPWVHPGLNSYSRLEDHYNILKPHCFSGQGTKVYNPQIGGRTQPFGDFPGLAEKWASAAEYVALYPNVLIGVHRDHLFAIMLDPLACDRTLERVEIYYADPEALDDARAESRTVHADMWKEVFQEDVFVVEGMQRGRQASSFDGGRFSPVMDEATHCFHAWVADRLSSHFGG